MLQIIFSFIEFVGMCFCNNCINQVEIVFFEKIFLMKFVKKIFKCMEIEIDVSLFFNFVLK